MFWSLLSYIVAKGCASPRNLTWFTRLFLLMRGWDLGTRLVFSFLNYGHKGSLYCYVCTAGRFGNCDMRENPYDLQVAVCICKMWLLIASSLEESTVERVVVSLTMGYSASWHGTKDTNQIYGSHLLLESVQILFGCWCKLLNSFGI